MRAVNNSVTLKLREGCSLLVLDRGTDEQKEKGSSNTGRAEKGAKKGGKRNLDTEIPRKKKCILQDGNMTDNQCNGSLPFPISHSENDSVNGCGSVSHVYMRMGHWM